MNEKNIWYFEDTDLYNVFCPHKHKKIGEKHVFKTYHKNEFIYFPEQSSKYIYLIAEGNVKIGSYSEDGKEIIKTILSKGEIFGELALVGEDKRSDFAQALDEEVSICPLTVEDMEQLMKDNKELSFRITKLIGLRLLRAERRIASLVFKDARSRIIEFLVDEAEMKGQKVGFETLVKNMLTHQDISRLTATSRQTVTTVLNELRESNIINFDRKRFLVRDLSELKKMIK